MLVKALPDEEARARVEAANADVMVACNWRTWIPPEIFNAPRLGTLNVHDSLLPAYAGFAPLNWALINGEPEVGITAHVMDEQLDRGSIILQPRVTVEPADTIGDLFAKTLVLFGPTTIAALDHMEHGTGERRAQDLSAGDVLPQARRRGQPHRLDAGPRRTSPTSCARRPTRTPTRTASTAAAAWRSAPRRSRRRAPAARAGGSSPARATA